MLNRFYIALLAFTILFSSCSDEEITISGKFSTGTFIVNQGAFGSGTGTITYTKDNEVIEDVFAIQNPGLVLGNIAQSMHKFDQKYFIAVNNAAKIVVVDAATFKYKADISLELPRYFVTSGEKLYVTSYKNDFQSGFINLIDHKSFKVLKSLPIDGLPEKIIAKDGLLYIVVGAPYATFQKDFIVVYDTQKDEIKETIKVGDNPNDIIEDKNGDIWVICSGFSNFNDPTKNTAGSVHKISGNKSVASIPLSNGATGLVTNAAKNKIYFMMDAQVFEYDLNNSSAAPKSIAFGFYYAISMDTQNDQIYLADAKDFQKNGEVKVIDTKGNLVKNIKTGVGPGFFFFVK